jgi:hypothetical protein
VATTGTSFGGAADDCLPDSLLDQAGLALLARVAATLNRSNTP